MQFVVSLFLVFCLSLSGCSSINKKLELESDNPVEEAVEAVTNSAAEGILEHFTGVDVDFDWDFTPESKEN